MYEILRKNPSIEFQENSIHQFFGKSNHQFSGKIHPSIKFLENCIHKLSGRIHPFNFRKIPSINSLEKSIHPSNFWKKTSTDPVRPKGQAPDPRCRRRCRGCRTLSVSMIRYQHDAPPVGRRSYQESLHNKK